VAPKIEIALISNVEPESGKRTVLTLIGNRLDINVLHPS